MRWQPGNVSKRRKRSPGNPARHGPSLGAPGLAREFERWMDESRDTFTDPSMARAGFGHLFAFATRAGLDVSDPDDTGDILAD